MIPSIPGFTIVWFDDFKGTGQPSTADWDIRTDPPLPEQGEVQRYSNSVDNVLLSGLGSLRIMPRKEAGTWTSGRIECKKSFVCDPRRKMIFQASLRTGFDTSTRRWTAFKQSGVWPAFWALGESFRPDRSNWPKCGEWDILEKRGSWGYSTSTLHYGTRWDWENRTVIGGTNNVNSQTPSYVQERFNTFSLVVDRTAGNESLTWRLNGVDFYTIKQDETTNPRFPNLWEASAHSPFFALFNVAIGTTLGMPYPSSEQPNNDTATGLAAGMEVEYFAVYKS